METDRLLIDAATEKDIDTIISFEQHPSIKNFIFRGTRNEHLAEINDPLVGIYVIKAKKDMKPIGFLIYDLDWESERFEFRRVGILNKNQGYGKEVFKRIFQLAFEELKMNKVWLEAYADNSYAIQFYESLGMHRDGVLRQNHKEERGILDQIVYSTLKSEYFQQNN